MDFLDTWHDEGPICPIDARHFRILKKFKMADLCPFLCRNWTLLLIIHHSVQLCLPNVQTCCNGVIPCSVYTFGTVTFLTRSPEVIKGHTFFKLTLLLIQELVNTFVILNIQVGTDKQCLTCKGPGVTLKGQC